MHVTDDAKIAFYFRFTLIFIVHVFLTAVVTETDIIKEQSILRRFYNFSIQ